MEKKGSVYKKLVEAEISEKTSGGPSLLALGGENWG